MPRFFEEHAKLLLKRRLPMMFRLGTDIRECRSGLRNADTECPVSLLPGKPTLLGKGLVHPFRRRALDPLDGLGERNRCRQRKQEMNVLFDAANG